MEKRILVVEDSADMRELLELYLTGEGYSVTVAIDGVAGLQAIDGQCPDLLITDIRMPNSDGIELIKQLKTKAECRELPIVVLTANGDGNTHKAREAGANVILRKPVQFDSLLDIVRELLKSYSP